MADKLDMSLDDIIKITKPGRGGRGSKRGGGFRGRSSRGQGGQGRGASRRGTGFNTRGGGIQRRSRSASATSPYQRAKEVPDVWQHDMYEGAARNTNRNFGGRLGGSDRAGFSSGKLLVSNLDFGVNDSDIRELFAEFGTMKKAAVHYDRSGRSLATAEVIYERRSDAVRALKQYNNVPLDGRAMSIQLVGAPASEGSAPRPAFVPSGMRGRGGGRGFARGGRGFSRPSRGGGGIGEGTPSAGRRGRGGRGARTKVPTAEELDAELDAYRMDVD